MSDEGFLARWSRRKRAAEAGRPVAEAQDAAPAPATPPGATAPAMPAHAAAPATVPGDGTPAPPAPAAPPAPDAPVFDPASLPGIDRLTAASDFTAFLRQEVPEALRRAALRKAWSLDPAIRDFVGPADYAWDFNAPDGVPGFALELGGDVKELLAQVFRAAEGEAPAEGAAGPAGSGQVAASLAAPEGDAPGEAGPSAGPAPATATPGRPAVPPAADPPSVLAAPEAAPAAEGPAPTPPRRHGSALPA
jgi:hypothetical protein